MEERFTFYYISFNMFDFTMGKDYLLNKNYGIKNKEWAGDTNAGLLKALHPHAGSPAGSAQQAP